jgi:uncharacterized protein YndB with AHSA1/START domain
LESKYSYIGGTKVKADVSLDFQLKSPIDKVWKALTDSEILAKWMWDNDFVPVVEHNFQFTTEPSEWWDGIVNGEVLEVDEPNKLSYTWESSGEKTTVTWTLKETSEGTHLHFEQAGFSEQTKEIPGALEGAISGWTQFVEKLKPLIE